VGLARVATVDEMPSEAHARPSIGWLLSADGDLGDALRLSMSWSSASMATTWSILLPPARSGQVRLPEMPDAFRGFERTESDTRGTVSASHLDDLARTDYSDYLVKRAIGDDANLDVTSAFR
jgi:hypothetical protein